MEINLARYIISSCYKKGKPVTILHLKLIMYFINEEYYKKTKKYLFDEEFIINKNGVLLKSVDEEFGWHYCSRIYETYNVYIPKKIKPFIDKIIEEKRKETIGKLIKEACQRC